MMEIHKGIIRRSLRSLPALLDPLVTLLKFWRGEETDFTILNLVSNLDVDSLPSAHASTVQLAHTDSLLAAIKK
jgi:hypothetical protein